MEPHEHLVLPEGLDLDDGVALGTARDDQPDSGDILNRSGKLLDGLFAVRAPHHSPLHNVR